MRLRTLAAFAAVGALFISNAPAGAANSVSINAVARNGAVAKISGAASFADLAEETVGGTVTLGTVATTPVAGPAGLVLKEGRIAPLADGSGLRFIWEVTDMPAEVPPEGVRYNWTFSIGDRQYQLQAKRSNMASVTTSEDPVGHARELSKNKGMFQLRGNCQAQYSGTPMAGCYSLAFLNGGFDTAKKIAFMDLPFNTKDSIGRLVAPDFKPGAVLVPSTTAETSIVAGAQAVASTSATGSNINDWNTYYVGKNVQIAAGDKFTAPEDADYATPVTLNPDGTFSGTLSGLKASDTKFFVRACNGATCSYASAIG